MTTIIVTLVIVAIVLGLVLMMMAFTYPELFKKGGKALARAARRAFGHSAGKP